MSTFHVRLVVTLWLSFSSVSTFAQWDQFFCFDDPLGEPQLWIDTLENPANIWQIGPPIKSVLDSAISAPHVIITDSLQHYPVNDTSSFTILHYSDCGLAHFDVAAIEGFVWVNTDTLHDYGKIEFSGDRGQTWVDLYNDTISGNGATYYPPHPNLRPALSGNTNGWDYFNISLSPLGEIYDLGFYDSVLIRFSFISDSIPDSLDGMMYDNLYIYESCEGAIDHEYDPQPSEIFPNPAAGQIYIRWDRVEMSSFDLEITDLQGRVLIQEKRIRATRVEVDISRLSKGLYLYRLVDHQRQQQSYGRFLVRD